MVLMNNSIIQAQCVNLKELNHLFIDLEYTKTQNKNFNVYRSRSFNQKNKKYLQLDEIKDALKQVDKSKLKYIYLTGKNSMTHPEFNHILRLCLTYCSVTIFSDGSCINDKKSRFLKRVEEEGNNEIIFKIEINHYDEKTNDEISGRGSFRKAIHAVTSLNKYGFIPAIEKNKVCNDNIDNCKNNAANCELDCMNSRLLTKSGVYNCPLLINDYRGRSGASLGDFSCKCYLETEECQQCTQYGKRIYSNNWV